MYPKIVHNVSKGQQLVLDELNTTVDYDVVIVDDISIPDQKKDKEDDPHQSWKPQALAALVQIIVPLLLYVLFQNFCSSLFLNTITCHFELVGPFTNITN
jgi:hypothetical protein